MADAQVPGFAIRAPFVCTEHGPTESFLRVCHLIQWPDFVRRAKCHLCEVGAAHWLEVEACRSLLFLLIAV